MGRETLIVLEKRAREIAPPKRAGMLHDYTGRAWPKCSLLIQRFDGYVDDPDSRELSDAKDYFGRDAVDDIGVGEIELPPRGLSHWREIGEVKEIFYDRAGTKAPGYFRHRFHKPRGLWRLIHFFKRSAKLPVICYARRGAYRLDLPEGCIIDDRGIALP